jgi:hypothetical protein
MPLTPLQAKGLVDWVKGTREQEISCDECLAQVAEFVDIELAGKTLDQALQVVSEHLADCPVCREEYVALKQAIETLYD